MHVGSNYHIYLAEKALRQVELRVLSVCSSSVFDYTYKFNKFYLPK